MNNSLVNCRWELQNKLSRMLNTCELNFQKGDYSFELAICLCDILIKYILVTFISTTWINSVNNLITYITLLICNNSDYSFITAESIRVLLVTINDLRCTTVLVIKVRVIFRASNTGECYPIRSLMYSVYQMHCVHIFVAIFLDLNFGPGFSVGLVAR